MNAVALSLILAASAPPLAPPPPTPVRPVVDEYQGEKVTDPYQWLEKADDPEVQAWSKAQDARTRAWLAARPDMEALRARVRQLVTSREVAYGSVTWRGGRYFALKYQPPKQQPFVVALDSLRDRSTEKVVL